jgi:hypothetical protein
MNSLTTLNGGCLCGAIRYRFEGEPRIVSDCHCSLCRRVSGSAYVTWLTVLRRLVTIEGEPVWFSSSDHGARGFCASCGTHVLAVSSHYEKYFDIPAGTLDEPNRIHPTRHVFAADRVAWHELDWSIPAHSAGANSPLIERNDSIINSMEDAE